MSDHIEIVEEHGDWRVVLVYDDTGDVESPRSEDGNATVMWCRHSRYNLGDRDGDIVDEVSSFVDEMLEWHSGNAVTEAVVKHLVRKYGATIVRPLYLYDHSGLALSAGANLVGDLRDTTAEKRRAFVGDYGGWDTSYIGFVFDTAESREHVPDIEKAVETEVEVYDSYLQNDVYGIRVERRVITTVTKRDPLTDELVDEDEYDDTWDEVDSCWGFIGRKWAEAEAKETLAGYLPKD